MTVLGKPRPMKVRGKRFAIVASQFNATISRALVGGARQALRRAGVAPRNIRLVWVPGAFELPVVALRLAASRPRPHAVIALGAIIRGQTPQYLVLAHAVAKGLTQVAVKSGIPVTSGVVVATSMAQAKARARLPLGPTGGQAHLPLFSRGGQAHLPLFPRGGQAGGKMGNRGAEAARAALRVLRIFERLSH